MAASASAADRVLTLNPGSSSLKFCVFAGNAAGPRLISGRFERIGLPRAELSFKAGDTRESTRREVEVKGHADCLPRLDDLLAEHGVTRVRAVAHRVVHGGPQHLAPAQLTPALLSELRRVEPFAPNHLPAAIELLEVVERQRPGILQVACFDTAFHRDLPLAARLLPIPRRYQAQGIRRYGFHGLAFASVLAQLRQQCPNGLPRRVLLAHLGNGASMAAVRDGKSVDTTMSFTPTAGLVMSTRSGDLDPGLLAYLVRTEKLGPDALERLVTRESGLLGLSETSSDVRDLLAAEATDSRAAEALSVFVHQGRKFIGALAATLGGLDELVFSGGIGENSGVLRQRLCADFEFLGLRLDADRNQRGQPVISSPQSQVTVRIIPADEEQQLAATAFAWLSESATHA